MKNERSKATKKKNRRGIVIRLGEERTYSVTIRVSFRFFLVRTITQLVVAASDLCAFLENEIHGGAYIPG